MSYPKKIVKVRPIGGLVTDIDASEVADEFYTSGNNVHFRSTFAERTQGNAEVYSALTTSPFRNVLNFKVGTTNFWVVQGKTITKVIEGSTESDITIIGGFTVENNGHNVWTSGLLNGIYFANNGKTAPMYWDGSPASKMLELPGWPAGTTCKAMRSFKYHLFAMDLTKPAGDFEMQVLWSNAAEPGAIPQSWTPLATNEAGDNQLSQTEGRIVDGLPLGASFIFYKHLSAFMAEYVGGNNVFNFRPLKAEVGILTRNCVVNYKNKHFVVTTDDIVLFDGLNTQSIVDNRMRDFFFADVNQDTIENTFVVAYPKKNEVWVCYPSTSSSAVEWCDKAIIWDGVANAWGTRDLTPITSHATIGIVSDQTVSENWDDDSNSWNSDTTIWSEQAFSTLNKSLVLIGSDATLQEVDSGSDFDGVPIESNIAKYSMSFTEPNRVKFVRRIVPHFKAELGAEIVCRIGSQMTINEGIVWSPSVTYTVGTSIDIPSFAQGKYLSFEFTSTGGKQWTLIGFDVEAEVRGFY
jgi:hypothetical protein